jgi:hypothetical protein
MSNTPESIVGRFDADPGEVALLPRLERYETKLATDGSHLIIRFFFANGQVSNVAIPTNELPRLSLAIRDPLETLRERRKES